MEPRIDDEAEDESKKSYHSPELTSYGNIREITQNAGGTMGMNDGGGGNDKTGL